MTIYDDVFEGLKYYKPTKEDWLRVEHLSTIEGSGFSGYHHTDEAKEKIRSAAKLPRKPMSEETKQKIAASKLGKTFSHSEEAKRKISEASKNRKPISEETRKRLSHSARNRKSKLVLDSSHQ